MNQIKNKKEIKLIQWNHSEAKYTRRLNPGTKSLWYEKVKSSTHLWWAVLSLQWWAQTHQCLLFLLWDVKINPTYLLKDLPHETTPLSEPNPASRVWTSGYEGFPKLVHLRTNTAWKLVWRAPLCSRRCYYAKTDMVIARWEGRGDWNWTPSLPPPNNS